jgi:hypothetical protein
MLRTWIIVTILAAAAGCGGGGPLGGGQTDAAVGADLCRHDSRVGTGAPGACGAARAYIDCESPNGAGCGCMTDNTSCSGCGAGATCTDKCSANEYAVSCGSVGPGNPSITYADPPAACRLVLASPAGVAFYCCPCL